MTRITRRWRCPTALSIACDAGAHGKCGRPHLCECQCHGGNDCPQCGWDEDCVCDHPDDPAAQLRRRVAELEAEVARLRGWLSPSQRQGESI